MVVDAVDDTVDLVATQPDAGPFAHVGIVPPGKCHNTQHTHVQAALGQGGLYDMFLRGNDVESSAARGLSSKIDQSLVVQFLASLYLQMKQDIGNRNNVCGPKNSCR